MNDKIGFSKLILPNLKINKPYINDNDYILFLASILRKNPLTYLSKTLNKLTYSNDERNNIVFLVSLQFFKPEEVANYKKLQSKTSLSDEQIIKFGSMIGMNMKKFVDFKLSVGGKDVPSDIKGPQIGMWIKDKEAQNFLGEGFVNEGRVLRVFDFDDTRFIYVKHKDGSESKLDYAKYNSKSTDVFDFRDFNKLLNNPKVIKKSKTSTKNVQ